MSIQLNLNVQYDIIDYFACRGMSDKVVEFGEQDNVSLWNKIETYLKNIIDHVQTEVESNCFEKTNLPYLT